MSVLGTTHVFRARMSFAFSFVLALLIILTVIPSAFAGTVSELNRTVTFSGASTAERIQVDVPPAFPLPRGTIIFTNNGGPPITPGAGCGGLPNGSVACGLDQPNKVVMNMSGGNDIVVVGPFFGSSASIVANGGTGDDAMQNLNDQNFVGVDFRGDGNNDILVGGPGADKLSGGSGQDALLGLGASDTLTGGSGLDQLFGDRWKPAGLGGAYTDYLVPASQAGAKFVPGSDTINAKEGEKDFVDCGQNGTASDVANVDITGFFTYLDTGSGALPFPFFGCGTVR